MALAALGLIALPKAARPPKARTRQIHARNARQAIAEAKALPVEARRHLAEIVGPLPEGWQLGGAGKAALASAAPVPPPRHSPRACGRPLPITWPAKRHGPAGSIFPTCAGCARSSSPRHRTTIAKLACGKEAPVNNTELLAFVTAESQRLRALDGPCAGSRPRQLERAAVSLKFTGANSEEEFDARIECNEEWVKAEAFERGWAEGRQASREIAHGVHLHN